MPYDKTPTEMKGQKGIMMKGQHGIMMKDKGQPMMKHGKGPEMSAELAFMPVIKDTTISGRASSIVNAGARSRMSGQPQIGDSPVKKFDRVVLGGNKEDKSKTKPGKKDFV